MDLSTLVRLIDSQRVLRMGLPELLAIGLLACASPPPDRIPQRGPLPATGAPAAITAAPTPPATAPTGSSSAGPAPTPVVSPDPQGWFEWSKTLHGHGPGRPGFHKRLRVFADGVARYFEEDDEELMPGVKAAPMYCGGTLEQAQVSELGALLRRLVTSLPADIRPPRAGGLSERLQLEQHVRQLGRADPPEVARLHALQEKILAGLACGDAYDDAWNGDLLSWPEPEGVGDDGSGRR